MRGRSIVIILFVCICCYLATGVAQIRPDETGIIRRFGKVVAKPGPGLWIGFPWGIDQIDRVSTRSVRQLNCESISYLSGDQNLVVAQAVVEYRVNEREAEKYLFLRDQVDVHLRRCSEAAMADWLASQEIDSILLTGRARLSAELAQRIEKQIAELQLGISILRVNIEQLAPPDEIRLAFDQVNEARTAMTTRENEAKRDADRLRQEAESKQIEVNNQTIAYALESKSKATAEAETFLIRLKQYRDLQKSNPDILTTIWWDETGKLLAGLKKRGRIELLDDRIGKDGLDLNSFVPGRK